MSTLTGPSTFVKIQHMMSFSAGIAGSAKQVCTGAGGHLAMGNEPRFSNCAIIMSDKDF
jgi:hypothetical protein